MITSNGTLCCITALGSLGLYRMPAIVRQGNPSQLPDRSKPYLIGAIVREVISVALYG
jgi:hypothetical protein